MTAELMNEILKARNYHEKEYEVRVRERITADFIRGMSEGVWLSELGVNDPALQSEKGGRLYVPYYPDPGTEPSDTADVRIF